MNETTTTTPQAPRALNPEAAVKALLAVAEGLRRHEVVNADSGDGKPLQPIDRKRWFQAAGNLLTSGVLNKAQKTKLKAARDELRRTKVRA
jgi:hypothetical protein